ncbi:hypothetical protein CS542_01765 [Pedobacter sp. IW39]|nr:hypothetical protein CS542_01765 [Pedobacter sp. IW39]
MNTLTIDVFGLAEGAAARTSFMRLLNDYPSYQAGTGSDMIFTDKYYLGRLQKAESGKLLNKGVKVTNIIIRLWGYSIPYPPLIKVVLRFLLILAMM